MKNTLIIGATPNKERYAYKAAERLTNLGHQIFLFGIKKGNVCGKPIINDWEEFKNIDTVTLYVGPLRQKDYIDKIISIKPKRVIFNPGTENPEFQSRLSKAGIQYEEACTLVLLSLNKY
ncbi:MAG: CoA-binding protein [Flavobacteriales bacterium]|nr:CoA-binding protein [Flavobacteriales bacterium]